MDNTDFQPTPEPWDLFDQWYQLAEQHEINDPNAMTLATVGDDGMPSARIMLLKERDNRGFVFFTNRTSNKGRQLAHPKAALCWHWKSLRRQIRAEGIIEQTTDAESDAYFAMRPRGSQIGAWASLQSQPMESRIALQTRVADITKQYEGKTVPRPPHWGGYRLTPVMVEFWQDREFRLHDRIRYVRPSIDATWTILRLYP